MSRDPVDIVMLTHNRLDHLVATVDALEARTAEPYRLTMVDNASGPSVREWLAGNRDRFHQVVLRPTNGHVPSLQEGIALTTSDPFLVTDPDIIVPEGDPSWLARLLDLMDRHPDFGLIGLGLDNSNRPAVLPPEIIDPDKLIDDEIVETGVGTVFQAIRRDALIVPYRSDGQACTTVRRAGFRVGWAPGIRAFHLGWDDFRLHPGHLASKGLSDYGSYKEVGLVARPPILGELVRAAPVLAVTRGLGVPDPAIAELAWGSPAVGPTVPGALSLLAPATPLPLDDDAAEAVVLTQPPADRAEQLVAEACRVARRAVVALAPLDTFPGRHARDLAPAGWTGREAPGPNEVALAMASCGDADERLQTRLRVTTLADRSRWLELFGAGAFGDGPLRLWIWEPEVVPDASPLERVAYDKLRVTPWTPEPLQAPQPRPAGLLRRLWRRADLRDRGEVALARRRHRRRA